MSSISLEVVDIQGYLWLTAYFHYFTPGSLRLQTRVHKVPLLRVQEVIEKASGLVETRRWMMRNEGPYPGYCHAPGTNECLPILCNCDYLTEVWNNKWQVTGNDTGTTKNYSRLYKTPST